MKVIWALVCALLLTGTTTAVSVAATTGDEAGPGSGSEPAAAVVYADSVAPHGFFWQLLNPQTVLPGSYLYALPAGRHDGTSKGTRSDAQFFEISSTGSNDVPEAALRAYKHAASAMAKSDPGCQISWTFLAAIGRVESNHGRFGGSQLGSDGVSRPAIVGPRLDGAGPFAAIADSDGGKLDGDTLWDRAVGQMQFLPSTWRSVARDGDGDGVANPGDLDDSALTSAVYLCGAGNTSTDAGMARAAYRYNQSDYYVALVLSFAHGYQTGAFVLPSPPPPPGQANKAATVLKAADVAAKPKPTVTKAASTPVVTPSASPTPKPVKPTTKPGTKPAGTPTPSSTPSPQQVAVDVDGLLAVATDGGITVGGQALSLVDVGGDTVKVDWDGDAVAETVTQELTGLVGKNVKLHIVKLGDKTVSIDFVGLLP